MAMALLDNYEGKEGYMRVIKEMALYIDELWA